MIEAVHHSSHGIVTTLLGLITLFFGGSAAGTELTDGLNTIWRVPEDPVRSRARSLFNLAKERLLAFGLVLGAGLFLLSSLIVKPWIAAAGRALDPSAIPTHTLIRIANSVLTLALITALFAFLFKVLPDVRLKWADAAAGAVFTSLLFTAGKLLLGIYLGKAGFADSYGAPRLPDRLPGLGVLFGAGVLPGRRIHPRLRAPLRFDLHLEMGPPARTIKHHRSPTSSGLRSIGILIAVISVLYLAREIVIPLAFAITLALILTPAVGMLQKIRVPRVPAVGIVMVLTIAAASGIGWVIFDQLVGVANELPRYQQNIHNKLEAMRAPGKGALGRATASVQALGKELADVSVPPAPGDRPGRRNAPAQPARPLPVQAIAQPTGELESARDLVKPFWRLWGPSASF